MATVKSAFWLAFGIAIVLAIAILFGFLVVMVAVKVGALAAILLGTFVAFLLWLDYRIPEERRR